MNEIINNIINSGDFTQINKIKYLDNYDAKNITSFLKNTDFKLQNYRLSEKLSDILFPEETSRLKKYCTYLMSFELNMYDNEFQRNKKFQHFKSYISDLLIFPTKKRVVKFLVNYTKKSNALKEIAFYENKTNLNKMYLLKTLQLINNEVKK